MSLPGIDALVQWARDFNVTELPASGISHPSKPEFRASVLQLGLDISSQAAGIKYYATKALMDADHSKPAGTQGRVYADGTAANNTIYVYGGSTWAVDTNYLNAVATAMIPILQPYIDEAEGAADAAAASAASGEYTLSLIQNLAGFSGWFWGPSAGYPSQDASIDVEYVSVDIEGYLTTFITPSGLIYTVGLNGDAVYGFDELIGPSAGYPAQDVDVVFDSVAVDEYGRPTFFYDTLGNRYVHGDDGFFHADADNTASDSDANPIWPTISVVGAAPEKNWTGYTVSLPDHRLQNMSGKTLIPAGDITFDTPTPVSVVNESGTLAYGNISACSFYLKYQAVSSFVLTKQSGGAVLAPETDYKLSPMGRMWGLQNVASVPVYANYTGHPFRYDIIYCDGVTGEIGVAKGTERGIDPESYMPVLPAGKIAMYNALVMYNAVELIPVYEFRNGVKRGEEDFWAQLKEHNRYALAPALKRLENGDSINLFVYSDSKLSQGKSTLYSQELVPNGTNANIIGYFSPRTPDDTKAAIPKYTQGVDPDFASYVPGSTDHTKVGSSWMIKAELERRYGTYVEHVNLSVGGTNSSAYLSVNYASPDGSHVNGSYLVDPGNWTEGVDDVRMNGSYAVRLNNLVSLITPGDIVLIGFGTNELNSNQTYANFVTIINAVKAVGGCPFILGVEHPSIDFPVGTPAVAYTTDQQARAAMDTGSAFFPTFKIEAPGYEGATGLSLRSAGNDNFNHSAAPQFRNTGYFAARSII